MTRRRALAARIVAIALLGGTLLSGTATHARAGTIADGLVAVGDFRGAGRQQIATLSDPNADLGLRIAVLEQGTTGDAFSLGEWFAAAPGTFDLARMKVVASDVDADGRSDLVVLYDDGGTQVRLLVFRSTGTAFTFLGTAGWYRSDRYAFSRVASMVAGNFSGAGRSGLLMVYQYDDYQVRIHYFESTGTSFVYNGDAGVYDSGPGQYDSARARFVAGRFTRSSGPDQIASFYQYPDFRVRVHVFDPTPAGLQPVNGWDGVYDSGTGQFDLNRLQLVAADVDGDGRSDVVGAYVSEDGTVRAHLFSGARSLAPLSPSGLVTVGAGQILWPQTRAVAGDWNGDKKGDLALLSGMLDGTARVALLRSNGSALGYVPGAYVTPSSEARTLACTACWALTGRPLAGDPGTRRPLYVKVDNAPLARPQVGLSRADLVYELLAEGNITRFAAVFQQRDPGVVGPIRSARFGDRYVLPMLHGALAFSGASTPITALIRADAAAGRYLDLDANLRGIYYRDLSRPAPNNLFVNGADLRATVADLDGGTAAVDVPKMRFFANPRHAPSAGGFAAAGGASTLTIPYRSDRALVRYDYVADTDTYARYQNSGGVAIRATDAQDGSPLAARNVVVIYTDIFDSGLRDSSDAEVLDLRLIGSGALSVFRNGLRVEGTWTRGTYFDGFQLTTKGGEPILLDPGQTWIHIIPADWTVPSR